MMRASGRGVIGGYSYLFLLLKILIIGIIGCSTKRGLCPQDLQIAARGHLRSKTVASLEVVGRFVLSFVFCRCY